MTLFSLSCIMVPCKSETERPRGTKGEKFEQQCQKIVSLQFVLPLFFCVSEEMADGTQLNRDACCLLLAAGHKVCMQKHS